MFDRRTSAGFRPHRTAAVGVLAFVLLVGLVSYAYAVGLVSGPITTLSDTLAGSTNVTYVFGNYKIATGEWCTGISITFPADTNVSGARAVDPSGTVAVSGQTVTYTFSPSIRNETPFDVAIGGIRNPTTPGAYNAGSLTFFTTNPQGKPKDPQPMATGGYTIVVPSMTLTIDRTSLNFGDLLPGDTPPAQQVRVTATATIPHAITRTITGDIADLGLTVTGTATGAKPAGTATFVDTYRVAPTWDSREGVPLAATVRYSLTP